MNVHDDDSTGRSSTSRTDVNAALVEAWGSVVVKALRHKPEGPGIDSRCRRGFFPWHLTASKNEYQVNPGGKGGRCVRLTTYPPSCADVKKSGSLNLLEPSGSVQACNGTAFYQSTTLSTQLHNSCLPEL
jgi:hypothetical protein